MDIELVECCVQLDKYVTVLSPASSTSSGTLLTLGSLTITLNDKNYRLPEVTEDLADRNGLLPADYNSLVFNYDII